MKNYFSTTINKLLLLLLLCGVLSNHMVYSQNCDVYIDVQIVQPVYTDDGEELISQGRAEYVVVNMPNDNTYITVGPHTVHMPGDQGSFDLGESGDTYDFYIDGGIYGKQQYTGTFGCPNGGEDKGCGCNKPAYHEVCGCDYEDKDNDGVASCEDPDDNNADVPPNESFSTDNANDPEGMGNFVRMASSNQALFYDIGESQYTSEEGEYSSGPYVLCAYKDGSTKWKKTSIHPGVYQLGANDVAYDPTSSTNDGVVVGDFENSLNFMGFNQEADNNGNAFYTDSYIIKFDGEGNTKWTSHLTSETYTYLKNVTILSDGSIVVTGSHTGDLHYNEYVYQTKGTNRTAHSFVLKLNKEGNPIWYQSELNSKSAHIVAQHEGSLIIGYISNQAAVDFGNEKYWYYRPMLMEIDLQTGNKLAWGAQPHYSYKAIKVVSTHIGDEHYYVCAQQRDVRNDRIWLEITHYDENLQPTWTKTVAATDDGNTESKIDDIAINNKGNLLMSVTYENTIWIQESMTSPLITSYTSKGKQDIMLLELDPSGDYVSSQSIGDEEIDMVLHLDRISDGSLVIGGCYGGELQINDENLRKPNNADFVSFFKVLETSDEHLMNQRNEELIHNENSQTLALYPNPNKQGDLWISYPFDSQAQYRIQLRDLHGKLLEEVRAHGINEPYYFMDIHQLSAGTYTITIISGEHAESQTLIVH